MTELAFVEEKKRGYCQYMYRYVDSISPGMYRLERYEIVKETPCGYWIKLSFMGSRRWVAKQGKNNFAKVTKEEALKNYWHRKQHQLNILENKLHLTRKRMKAAGRGLDGVINE